MGIHWLAPFCFSTDFFIWKLFPAFPCREPLPAAVPSFPCREPLPTTVPFLPYNSSGLCPHSPKTSVTSVEPLGCWPTLPAALFSSRSPPPPLQPCPATTAHSLCYHSFSLCQTACGVLWAIFFGHFLSPRPPATMGHLSYVQRNVSQSNRLVTSLSRLNLSSPLASSYRQTQCAEVVSAFNCSWPRPVPSCFRVGCEMAQNSPLMWSPTRGPLAN